VAENGAGVITTYNTTGLPIATPIIVPPVPPNLGPGVPTGLIYYSGNLFNITQGLNTGPSRLLVATDDGMVCGYNASVNPTTAIIAVNRSNVNAVYKGLTIANNLLYVADFYNGRIDVFDSTFTLQAGYLFTDPSLPAGFAPFNIVYLNNQLYVLYAKQDLSQIDDISGPGNGYVSVFNTSGAFVSRLISGGYLNSPWAMIQVPLITDCTSQNVLLIGNFGNGTITAYNTQGTFLGKLQDNLCTDIYIDGLWGLAQSTVGCHIYFASGPNHENNGIVGVLKPVSYSS